MELIANLRDDIVKLAGLNLILLVGVRLGGIDTSLIRANMFHTSWQFVLCMAMKSIWSLKIIGCEMLAPDI